MSDEENKSASTWEQPSHETASPAPPAPEASVAAPMFTNSGANKSKISLKIGLAISVVVVLFVGLALTLNGGSDDASSSKTEWLAFEYRGSNEYDVFLASLKEKEVATGTRLADQNYGGFESYSTIKSSTQNWVNFVRDGDTMFTWGEDGEDKELSAVDTKNGLTTSIYRGSDIFNIKYIENEKIFLISDDGSCFSTRKDEPSTRLGYGSCLIGNGKVITSRSEDSEVTLNEMNPDGSDPSRYTFPLQDWSIRNNGRIITGVTEQGIFEAYQISTGKRVFAGGAEETITVLSESSASSNLLLAVENPGLEDSTIDVGVMVSAEGGASFLKIASPNGASGLLSPKGDQFLLIAKKSEESSDQTVTKYKVSDKSSTEIATAESIEDSWSDDFGRYAIATDSEIIFGDFENGFQTSVRGSFD